MVEDSELSTPLSDNDILSYLNVVNNYVSRFGIVSDFNIEILEDNCSELSARLAITHDANLGLLYKVKSSLSLAYPLAQNNKITKLADLLLMNLKAVISYITNHPKPIGFSTDIEVDDTQIYDIGQRLRGCDDNMDKHREIAERIIADRKLTHRDKLPSLPPETTIIQKYLEKSMTSEGVGTTEYDNQLEELFTGVIERMSERRAKIDLAKRKLTEFSQSKAEKQKRLEQQKKKDRDAATEAMIASFKDFNNSV